MDGYLILFDLGLVLLEVIHHKLFVVVQLVHKIGQFVALFELVDDGLGDGVKCVEVA